MRNLFFFGSLRDRELLEVVIGRSLSEIVHQSAHLPGFRSEFALGELFPVLIPDDASATAGDLVSGLTDLDIERVRFFEDIDYHLASAQVVIDACATPIETQVFVSTGKLEVSGTPWSLESLTERDMIKLRLLAKEHMAHFGHLTYEEVDAVWSDIVARVDRMLAARGLQ